MKTNLRLFLTCCALLALAAGSPRASEAGETVLDTGRLLMSDHGRIVASEEFRYTQTGDSLTVSATVKRQVRNTDGTSSDFSKSLFMVTDAMDFGLRSYVSNLNFGGHVQVRGVIPGDTAMTVYTEIDGGGSADRMVQPPGRLFIMDPGMFTLFDVICRNFKGKAFTKRTINVLALSNTNDAVEATVTDLGADTLRWGSRRTPLRKLKLSDPSGDFTVWSNSEGQLIRLEHVESDLVVMREPPPAPAKKPAAKKAVAKKPAATR